jgi:multiple sugar transport system permease protein
MAQTAKASSTDEQSSLRRRPSAADKIKAERRRKQIIGSVVVHVLAIGVGLGFLLPFFWLITTSLKPASQMFAVPPVWIPNPFVLTHYPRLFQETMYPRYMLNTLLIALPASIGTVISCSMAGYGLSRIDWKGREVFFALTLATLMIPFLVTMVPIYILFRNLGWLGSYLPLIVPHFLGNGYYIFLFRQFFRSIPIDLLDAARVDGASELGIFARIVLPLSKPALAVVALFSFVAAWGDFLGPLIYINEQEHYTVAIGLYRFIGDRSFGTDYGLLMAGSVIMILPIFVIFLLAQRTFIEGIRITGLK